MEFFKISISDAKNLFEKLGCDKGGIQILSKKCELHTLYIKQMHVGAANILKQDALSIGADLAVPTGVITAKEKYVDGILIGSKKHFELLSRKELAQPFGLKKLALSLKSFTRNETFETKIMGVINANEDSFYKESRFNDNNALLKIKQMIEDGASIIDLGGVSSKPGSNKVDPKVELLRVQPIIDLIKKNNLYEKVDFSIDSYAPLVVEYALNNGFKIINDITGLKDDKVCELAAKYNAKVVIMHMQNDPLNMQNDPKYENIILDIDTFFNQRIEKALNYGISDMVLDVGIGFGKTLDHNLKLLKNLGHFKHFGYELLIGASRKSMIDMIDSSSVEQRLPGTLAIHLESVRNGASIIRCHDVKEHNQAIKVFEAISKNEIL